jgi:uncharacterized protein (UPF0276 family)
MGGSMEKGRGGSGRFAERVAGLPTLGLGLSTEYGARRAGGLDPLALARQSPAQAAFLELGIEVEKGLDEDGRRWVAEGRATTYHFLDVNLDDPDDFDGAWLAAVRALVAEVRPAWLCGDAGLWHFGPRGRGQMLLLPPTLAPEVAEAMAMGIARLREETGREVLPENPPGQVFIGPMHMLDFFARLADAADTGVLLDLAHLAIFQRVRGHAPLTAFDGFPWERVVELHVAGGRLRDHKGLQWVDDDHGLAVLDDTWALLEAVIARAPNVRAVVFECERNTIAGVLPGLSRIADACAGHPLLGPHLRGATRTGATS